MSRAAPVALALAFALAASAGCVVVDGPMLALRSVAGGIHNKRQVSGIRPFFLPDGRLGATANGALLVEETPGGGLVRRLGIHAELDEPDAGPDGRALVLVSGHEQVTAGGGHNDHVFQVYAYGLADGDLRAVTRSRRAEAWPRLTRDGRHVVLARRAEYDGWSLDDPWGAASLFVVHLEGGGERRLTGPLAHPVLGLDVTPDDALVVYGARTPGASAPALFAVELAPVSTIGGAEPRELAANAWLPAAIPGTDELLVARAFADGNGLARVGLDGTTRWERPLGLGELRGLALDERTGRIALSEAAPEAGRFGEHRLIALADEGAEPELLLALDYRLEKAFKPLDVVKPPSWWFRADASPGSR